MNCLNFKNARKYIIFLNVWLVISIYLVFRLKFLGYVQRWDGNWYLDLFNTGLSVFQRFDFNSISWWKEVWLSANFLGHPSIAYVLWLYFGNILIGDVNTSINVVNISLSMISIYAFYNIACRFYPNRKFENFLITLLFSFNPLFLATSVSLNLDFPLLIFEVALLHALLYRKWFLVGLWGLSLLFCKETGLVIYLLSTVFYFIFYRKELKFTNCLYLFVPGFIWILSKFILGGLGWNNAGEISDASHSVWRWGSTCMFCFGINENNIKLRLSQIFIMNFGWILTIVVIIAILKLLYSLRKKIDYRFNTNTKIFLVILFTFLGWLGANLLLVVMPFPRYVVAGVFYLIFIFYVSLNYLLHNKRCAQQFLLVIILVLNIFQVVEAIDPSMSLIYGRVYLGKHLSSPIFGFHDGLVYNLQFVFVDGLENEVSKVLTTRRLLGDNTTGYFFQGIKNFRSINDLYVENIKKGDEWQYVYVPWLSSENSMLIIENNFDILSKQSVVWDGYDTTIFNLVAK